MARAERLIVGTDRGTEVYPDHPLSRTLGGLVRYEGFQNLRLGGLSGECNRVLTVASAIGREFDFDLLARMTDSSDDDLLDVVDEAVSARVIEDTSGAIERYRFTHALIQQTLYERQTTSRRARLHARIGETLEDVYGEEVEARAAGPAQRRPRGIREAAAWP